MNTSSASPVSYENNGWIVLALGWSQTGIAMVVVFLRFYTRYMMRGIVIEDWLMLLALIMFAGAIGTASVLVHYGLGRHQETLTAYETVQVAKWDWIPQPFNIMALVFVKLSITALLLRLLGPQAKYSKWFLYISITLFTLTMVVASITTFAQCNPPRALWEDVPGAVCWDASVQAGIATLGGAFSAFMDFALALLPLSLIRGLTMSRKKKGALAVLLGAGILSGVFGIVKTTLSNTLAVREDISWQLVPLYSWAGSEAFINIVCGSLPTLKPLYEAIVNKKPLRRKRNSQYPSGTGNSAAESSRKSLMRIFRRKVGEKQESSTELNMMRDSLDMGRFGVEPAGSQIRTSQTFGYSYHVQGSKDANKEFGVVPI